MSTELSSIENPHQSAELYPVPTAFDTSFICAVKAANYSTIIAAECASLDTTV